MFNVQELLSLRARTYFLGASWPCGGRQSVGFFWYISHNRALGIVNCLLPGQFSIKDAVDVLIIRHHLSLHLWLRYPCWCLTCFLTWWEWSLLCRRWWVVSHRSCVSSSSYWSGNVVQWTEIWKVEVLSERCTRIWRCIRSVSSHMSL